MWFASVDVSGQTVRYLLRYFQVDFLDTDSQFWRWNSTRGVLYSLRIHVGVSRTANDHTPLALFSMERTNPLPLLFAVDPEGLLFEYFSSRFYGFNIPPAFYRDRVLSHKTMYERTFGYRVFPPSLCFASLITEIISDKVQRMHLVV